MVLYIIPLVEIDSVLTGKNHINERNTIAQPINSWKQS